MYDGRSFFKPNCYCANVKFNIASGARKNCGHQHQLMRKDIDKKEPESSVTSLSNYGALRILEKVQSAECKDQ